ncbi:MAG: AAA family ATPase [Caldilineaceae bacterium]
MLVNPYIAGNPVGGSEAFVGRTDILRTVLRVLKNPGENAIVLYGQRRIGKTSVLLELMRRLPHEGPYQPIYFDLQDKAALPLSTVLRELMQRIAAATGVPAPTVTNDAPPEQFQTTFLRAVLQQLPLETSLVLLFDEFDVLDNPGEGQAGKEFFPYLRNLLTFNSRLQFGFVIGRRPEDLSSFTLSIFKAIKTEHISLLTAHDTAALVRLSEQNGSLHWSEDAIAQVYALTGGHPFLTQQLCQELWETAWQDDPQETPLIASAAVDAAIEPTLRSATNALEWLWDGLRPAQRIVASALAEAGPQSISQEELESRLQQSGVRILVGELQDAPRILQDWDLLEPGKAGYRFRVELLRRWIVQNKPLARVQQEIDFVQPAAENLFLAAYAFYQAGQLKEALPLLRQVVTLNPNHVRGALVLSEILLAQKEVDEAKKLLESLYQYHPGTARPRLVQVLLAQVGAVKDETQQLALYERVLSLEPAQPEARNGRQAIWLHQVTGLEKTGQYEAALQLARKLAAELPNADKRYPDLALLERKTQLAGLYQRGIAALEANDRVVAIQELTQVIALEPTFRETTRYLHLAIAGVDSRQLEADLTQARQRNAEQEAALEMVMSETTSKVDAAEAARHSAEAALESERALRRQYERELERLRLRLDRRQPLNEPSLYLENLTKEALESERALRRQQEHELAYLRKQLNLNELPPLNRFWRQPPALLTWSLATLVIILLFYILGFSLP